VLAPLGSILRGRKDAKRLIELLAPLHLKAILDTFHLLRRPWSRR
jgi:hypothetical protein